MLCPGTGRQRAVAKALITVGKDTSAVMDRHSQNLDHINLDAPCSSSAVQATVSQVPTYALKPSLVHIQVRLWISQPANDAALYIHFCYSLLAWQQLT